MNRTEASALPRIHNSVLASRERNVLNAMAGRLPASVTPDQLTFWGVVGGAITALGCILSNLHDLWLLLAVIGLAVNWAGDSLDGTVARFRGIERPRYGFFLDQFCDVATHFMMLIGLGLSPHMDLSAALLALLGSLAIMFYGHLKLQFARTWQVSHYGVGPTELRIVIAAGFLMAVLVGVPSIATPFGTATLFDAVGVLVFIAAIACILVMFVSDRRTLAEIDPPRYRVPAEVTMREIEPAGARVNG